MAKIENTIAALELKLKQAKALKQKVEARKRVAEQKANRSQDTRRKILIGSLFMQRATVSDEAQKKLLALLDPYLTRTDDRALFDLQPLTAANLSPSGQEHAAGS
ncbi:MAG: mobilization protein [Pseudomonadota bacterium]|nr:mobilization protein [Pseudomonadota bacterium]